MSDICFVCGELMGWGDRVHTDAGTRHHGCVPFGTDVESEQEAEALEDLEDYLLNNPAVTDERHDRMAALTCRLPTCMQPAVKDGDYCVQHRRLPRDPAVAALYQVPALDEAAVRIAARAGYETYYASARGMCNASWEELHADPQAKVYLERLFDAERAAIAAYLAAVRKREGHS